MKHAFLIMAHDNWEILKRLLKKLDHVDNDIYIHIDQKSIIDLELTEEIKKICKYSLVEFVKRYRINWGGYSQINCEMRLFEAARKGHYDYYHVLSGIDFPIKSMRYIHDFFEKNRGYEFVYFCSEEFNDSCSERYAQYHLLQEHVGKETSGMLYLLEKASVKIQQKILKINRTKKYPNIVFKCGSNWCSLTHEFVDFLLTQEEKIKEWFSFSICCDECFVQTILYNSMFSKNIYYGNNLFNKESKCLRSVDWNRGKPYTYEEHDYEELVSSENLFCRKVSDKEERYEKLISKLEQL